jgi:hypothetical protein
VLIYGLKCEISDGFSAEELDFITNYDIKYRMGRDAAGDGSEDGE